MTDVHDEDGHRVKRFKHQSYNEQLKEVHAPSALSRSKVDEALEDESCMFNAALHHWMELNLSPSFISFAKKAQPLSQSLPLLVHSWREVIDLWLNCVEESDDEALKALFDLLQKLVQDLRSTLEPPYEQLLQRLTSFLSRRISPESLIALLAALTTLFKYLLLPQAESGIQATWEQLCKSLEKCNPEVQRAVAEVWASVLRRVKKQQRKYYVKLMAEDTDETLSDFVAWSFTFACKSVAQTIHTCGPSLVLAVLDCNLTATAERHPFTSKLLRRVVTALIHHCAKPEQFKDVSELIIERFRETLEIETSDLENLRRMLEVMAVICEVRQGSRLITKQISQTLETLLKLPFTSLQNALLPLATAALTATPSDLSVWMNAGRRLIDHAWSSSASFAVLLTGTLLELNWGGFKQFALPPFTTRCLEILGSDDEELTLRTLRVLALLMKNGVLKGVEESWRARLGIWVRAKLERHTSTPISEDFVLIFQQLTSLIPILSLGDITQPLQNLAESLVNAEENVVEDYSSSWASRTWVLGRILRVFAFRKAAAILPELDIRRMLGQVILKWKWSEYVMIGVVEAVEALGQPSTEILSSSQQREITTQLFKKLNSHSRIIRRSSLQLLTSPWFNRSSTEEVLKRCLAAELVPLSVQGVRERVLRIGRVAQVVRDGDTEAAEGCVRWLLGQLKVNLRPIWSPASAAIASLAARYPDIVWSNIFADLSSLQTKETADPDLGAYRIWEGGVHIPEDEMNESEKMWRDPSAHKVRLCVTNWVRNESMKREIIEDQKHRDRFDTEAYESQLLTTLAEFPSLAEKHSRELVPLFLSFGTLDAPTKPPRTKLANWLNLFSHFTNPKAFFSASTIKDIYTYYVSHPDQSLQAVSLSCLLTYKTPALVRNEEKLRSLMDGTKWRDELAALELEEFEAEDREVLVPVLIRIFFGMMLEHGRHGKAAGRRVALLSALGPCTEEELALLVDLMLRQFGDVVELRERDNREFSTAEEMEVIQSEKQQIGFLELLQDVLRLLGSKMTKSWPRLLGATITLTAQAQKKLRSGPAGDFDSNMGNGEEESGEKDEESKDQDTDESLGAARLRQLRIVRQLGLKRLADFFRLPVAFDFQPYLPVIFRTVISPRVPLLDRENTQSPSALLDLFDVWSKQQNCIAFLARYDSRTLGKVYDCLIATNVKPAVLMRTFDIVERVLDFSKDSTELSDLLVEPYMSGLLNNVAKVVQKASESGLVSSVVAQREIGILSQISGYIVDPEQSTTLLALFLPLLRKPHKSVPEKTKVDLLRITCDLLPRIPALSDLDSPLFTKAYESFSSLLSPLRSRNARACVIDALKVLCAPHPSMGSLIELLASLNAYSATRIDEPDFDRRLEAFMNLNEKLYSSLTGVEWIPILNTTLCFIYDEEELSIRSNASLTMKRFIDSMTLSDDAALRSLFTKILFPGLKRGLRSKSDPVRSEIIVVLGYAVNRCDKLESLQEMKVLLAGGDDEANFFNNIYHVQLHRRIRALRRLADFCDQLGFRNSTLQDIFLPIVNGFIAAAATTDHHLVNEAILTLGRIAKHLSWASYFALVQQYIRLATEHSASERVSTRVLLVILDNFHFALDETVEDSPDTVEREVEGKDTKIAADLPHATTKIYDAVNNRLLPTLLKHLEKRDELEESNRIPIAAGIAKVAMHLPKASQDIQIPRLLTVLAQVFRSKSQETRDLTREAYCRIAVTLGPRYLPEMIKQLREALLRGPQLHVLAFVTHSLLVHVTSPDHVATFEKLDECVPAVAHISSEVIFGQSGRDVESEGFKTKMKEVRSSSNKGMDSFAILAKHVTPSAFSSLLLPVKAIMQQTESVKIMQLVDEVLRRISTAVNANGHFGPPELLTFCHTLISQNARFFQESVSPQKRKAKKVNDTEVKLKRTVEVEENHYSNNSWRFICFGLDLFNTAIKRGRFDFGDPKTISHLESMVKVIGNTLYAANGNIVSAGLKATAQIVKCPLKDIDKSLPVYVRQTLEIVRESGSIEADVTQTAFKTLAVMVRDCPSSQVKEKDLSFLLELLAPDLEEVTRQATAFALLRAIVSRKFVVPEIYDLMVKISEIMVTNQSTQVQELCRSVLLQFLLDYPQGKGRLKQQFAFLVKNLSYVFESGRKSVMELLSAIIQKFNDDLIAEYADLFFVALVMVVANDESASCREMAAQLIKLLIGRLREEQRHTIMSHLRAWSSQHDNAALSRVSSQAYGLVLDALKNDSGVYLQTILDDVNTKLVNAAREFVTAAEEDEELIGNQEEWQIPYQALVVISKVFQSFPDIVGQHDKVAWPSVVTLLLYPHAWVRTASCRLLGSLFAITPVEAPKASPDDEFPLSLKGMKSVADSLSSQLKSENLDEPLSLQIVKNLFYIGKCFCLVRTENGDKGDKDDVEEQSESEDEKEESQVSVSDPLPWLFSRLSYQARSAHIARRNKKSNLANWSRQPSAIFRWFAAMASHMDAEQLSGYLPHILSPLYRIVEDDTIRDPQFDDLKILALELQDLVQSKVGTTKFANVYNKIRQKVISVQHDRKAARALQVATNPQIALKRRRHKNANKKESRKRKNAEFAEHKVRMKFSKKRKVQ